jgi:hypothetical protein
VSVRFHPDMTHEVLAVSDARTGRIERSLHALPWDGMQVSGTALDRDGRVWVTLSRGPLCADDHSTECRPQAGTCKSEVVVLDPADGSTRTVLRGADDELVSDAQPSPDGRRLAYLHTGCARSYFVADLMVRDLDGGHTTTIGGSLPPCHALFMPRWTADGSQISVVYGAARIQTGPNLEPPASLGYESCTAWSPPGITVLPADHGQSGLVGRTIPPRPGCAVGAAVPTAAGLAAIEQCGTPIGSGPDHRVLLLRFAPGGAAGPPTSIGRCGDGAQVAVDDAGRALIITSYQFCNPPGRPPPVTKLLTAAEAGAAPRLVRTVPLGEGFDGLSW